MSEHGSALCADTSAALNAAAAVLNYAPRSRAALISRLLEKGFSPSAAVAAADRLEQLGLLCDRDLAAALTSSYANRGYGPAHIRAALRRKLFEPEDIELALEDFEPNREKIEKYIASKVNGRQIDRKLIRKITDGLYRRGFGWDDINAAVRDYLTDAEDEILD